MMLISLNRTGASFACSLVTSKPVDTQLFGFVFTVPHLLNTGLISNLGAKKNSLNNVFFSFTILELKI